MIVQFNMIRDERCRQYGNKMFYHWKPNYPNDNEIVQLLVDYWGLGGLQLRQKKSSIDPIIIEMEYGAPVAEVFPIFCSYDKNGLIVDLPDHVKFGDNNWYIVNKNGFADLFR